MISIVTKALAWLFAHPKEVVEIVEDVVDAVRPSEPSNSLPYSAVEEQRKQIDSATSFKVK